MVVSYSIFLMIAIVIPELVTPSPCDIDLVPREPLRTSKWPLSVVFRKLHSISKDITLLSIRSHASLLFLACHDGGWDANGLV
jgi:hypothetical protein